VTSSPANALTTTIDPSTGQLEGLHPDNHDGLPVSRRLTESRRRLVINLGPGARWLLVATPDVLDITRALHPGDEQRVPRTNDVREYAVRNPDALIVHRLGLEPGEGYVGPSELMVHDGSTYGTDEPSDIAHYLGRWRRGFFPSLLH
jgi:hypothetical protein